MCDSSLVLGRQVERRREQIGLSVPRLAKLAGLHPDTVRRIEEGKGNPKLKSVDLLATSLKTESWQLLKEGKEGPPSDFEVVETAERWLDQAFLVVAKKPVLRKRLMKSLVRALQGLRELERKELNETERRLLHLLKLRRGEVEGAAKELALMLGKSPRSFWYAVTALEGSWITVTHQRGRGKKCRYRLLEVGESIPSLTLDDPELNGNGEGGSSSG